MAKFIAVAVGGRSAKTLIARTRVGLNGKYAVMATCTNDVDAEQIVDALNEAYSLQGAKAHKLRTAA